MYEKILILILCILVSSCSSTNILLDDGTGVEEYRGLQTEQRDEQTGIAITGNDIEHTTTDIGVTSESIGNTIEELESTIRKGETDNDGIGDVLQCIRERQVPKDILVKLGIIDDDGKLQQNTN